jgi:uncharacterized HAD superfamily protein
MPKSKPTVTRVQPRDALGKYGTLPPIVPTVASNKAVTISSNEDSSDNELAKLYARFTATHGRAPIIGLDLDGTTADMTGGWRPRVARARGISDEDAITKLPEPDEYAMWSGQAAWFESKQEFLTQFQLDEKDGMYREFPVYEGASEVIHRLHREGFVIKAVTARSADFNHDTKHWLESQGLPVEEIINPGFEKHTLQDIDIFIDDAPHVINGLVDNQRKVIIFNQEYNGHQAVDSEQYTRRMNGWELSVVTTALADLMEDGIPSATESDNAHKI